MTRSVLRAHQQTRLYAGFYFATICGKQKKPGATGLKQGMNWIRREKDWHYQKYRKKKPK
ncbi:hypothetical protein [Janthinobacterium sp. LB3P118]|uniref:hypothetical protein n=1 Tax=Janthinobacterium sp. LB3P118 TaxID=3424195 RepID=UPI003F27D3BA